MATLERFTVENPGNFTNRGQRLRDGYDFRAAAPISQLTTAEGTPLTDEDAGRPLLRQLGHEGGALRFCSDLLQTCRIMKARTTLPG